MIAEQLIANNNTGTVTKSYKADKRTENPKRSIAKSISWRIIGTLDTILISWIVTGTLSVAFSIGVVELFTKMILYFFHERIWNKISWGR
ncbi:DUF2061 domain-containing protein [Arenibacter sp. F26102]|uniref:DUF2061 domain-containing protein n=1 Tax=Arenibacter sp. F26102 TaxID=2926416 RepID=UPI001FF2257D|nr:DUF2061 domain-containing protein [Arenibacter sp. F26102]MCK0144627.1 DUF2061 domain-containing protein [Arenibacter sp. F26102]